LGRVGLVLGAGGAAGVAYHAGVLAGLAEGMGWDPRSAELVMGTSAGSITASALRAGLSAQDLAARIEGSTLSDSGAELLGRAEAASRRHQRIIEPARFPAGPPAAPGVLVAAGRRPWQVRPGAMLAGLLPAGTVSTAGIAEGVDALFRDLPGDWPDQTLWICAVRLDTGRLAVFGRKGSPPAEVGEATAASCAIPAYFAPVSIGGARYVDGGAHSLTNLAEVAGCGLDLVVVSAPMSRSARRRLAEGALLREIARFQLGIEASRVRSRHTHVIAFQPTLTDQAAMGRDFMDASKQVDVMAHARASTLRRLERADVRRRLAPLNP